MNNNCAFYQEYNGIEDCMKYRTDATYDAYLLAMNDGYTIRYADHTQEEYEYYAIQKANTSEDEYLLCLKCRCIMKQNRRK